MCFFAFLLCVWYGGTAAAAPLPFRPGNPALCGSHPLVTPYYCRLGDLLCFVFICQLFVFFSVNCVFCVFLQHFDTVGWVFWPVKTVAHITYTVLVETLNPAQSVNQSVNQCVFDTGFCVLCFVGRWAWYPNDSWWILTAVEWTEAGPLSWHRVAARYTMSLIYCRLSFWI